jgi:hypothetical protein
MRGGLIALIPVVASCNLVFKEQPSHDAALDASSDARTVDAPIVDAATGQTNLAFITNETFDGNLEGILGANNKCQLAADAAGARLPGTFIAVIATKNPAYNALNSLVNSRGWFRTDGELVADMPSEFHTGLRSPVILDPSSTRVLDGVAIWTGLASDGTASGSDCGGFEQASNFSQGTFGQAEIRSLAITGNSSSCNMQRHLLCVSTGQNTAVMPRVPSANRMFVLTAPFNLGGPTDGSLAGIDEKCQADAIQQGLPTGTFVALLSTTSQSAIDRSGLSPNTDYVRLDGARIGKLNAVPRTFINLDAAGSLVADGTEVWTGGSPNVVSLNTCTDWTNALATGGYGSVGHASARAYAAGTNACSNPKRVYCVEKQ